jgi:hypothetical protein
MFLPKPSPDAVLVPKPYLPSGRAPHQVFRQLFAPVLGSARVAAADQVNMYFLFAHGNQRVASLYFPSLGDRHHQERYDWYVVQETRDGPVLHEPRRVASYHDAPGAVKYGYAREDTHT